MKVFSVDAETNGLYGPAIAIGVTVRESGREVARFQGRIPDLFVTNEWVIENVLPALKDMPITHESSEELEEAFWVFWMEHREGAMPVAHSGYPVETGLFRRCAERRLAERMFLGPFPLHELETVLLAATEGSVRPIPACEYRGQYDIAVPFEGSSHHPLYDAVEAAVVWEHALCRLYLVAR